MFKIKLSEKLITYRKWWILAAMSTCLALSFIDMTAISVSLPQIQKLLQASNVQLQWVVNAYLLTLGVFIIAAGRLGDIHGHRQIFLLGTFLFLITSITCAMAPTIKFLIASRALQGFAGALITPNSSTIMLNTFPAAERGKATGLYVGIASIFLASGSLIGGFLTQLASWRLVFWINVPLLIFSMIIVFLLLEKERKQDLSLDWSGLLSLATGMSLLIFTLMEGGIIGWKSPLLISLLILAIISLTLFVWIEKHAKQPLIDFSIFKNKTYVGCLIAMFFLQIALITGVFRAIWFQTVLGYSPLMAGILVLPGTVPILVVSPLAGRIVDKYGSKSPATLGLLLTILGMLFTAYTMQYQNYWLLFPGLLLFGIGAPLAITPIMLTGLSSVNLNKRGVGAGTLHAVRQIGGTVGLAVVGAIITTINLHLLQGYLSQNFSFLQPQQIDKMLAKSPASQATLSALSTQQIENLHYVVKGAYTFAFSFASYITAIFLLIALLAILSLKNYRIKD